MHRDRLLQGGIPVPYAAAHGRGLFSSRKDVQPPLRISGSPFIFSSRKDSHPQSRNWGNSPLTRGLGGLFSSRKDAKAQRNNSQFFAPSLLCELFFYFFLLAKTYRPVRCGRQAQRNYGLLGMTSGGLCGLASLRDLLFFLLAKAQSLPLGRPQSNVGS